MTQVMMKTMLLCLLTIGLTGASMEPALLGSTRAADVAVTEAEVSEAAVHADFIKPLTIAKGQFSQYGMNVPGYAGSTMVINTPAAWAGFWHLHTGEDVPPPEIDLARWTVIVAIQGPRTSGGGPNISIARIEHAHPITRVMVIDDARPGPLDVLTNPFHIVAVKRRHLPAHRSVSFERLHPGIDTGVIEGRVLTLAPDDVDARPIRRAAVTLLKLLPDGSLEPVADRKSGLDGSYFFVNVPPGPYLVTALKRGFEPAEEWIQIEPNQYTRLDIVLQPVMDGEEAPASEAVPEP